MSILRSESLFVRQNFWLKLAILLLGSATAVATPLKALLLVTGLHLLYLTASPVIYVSVGMGLKRFLPFFAGYSLFAMLMGMDYLQILVFMLRIVNLVLLMVYFAAGMDLHRLMEDMQGLKELPVFGTTLFFLLAISVFIKEFRSFYSRTQTAGAENEGSPGKSGIAGLLPRLVEAIALNWQTREKVEATSRAIFSRQYYTPAFLTYENLLGVFYITALFLVVAL